MPTMTDTSVMPNAYDTSGNGGRKLIMLNDGTLIAVVKNGATVYIRKSTDNGATWTSFTSITAASSIQDMALATNGTYIYLLYLYNNVAAEVKVYDKNVTAIGTITVDSGQTSMGNCSLVVSDTGTELYAVWTSKNGTYTSGNNIRYAKGTISGNGSATFDVAVQGTTVNTTNYDIVNPVAFYAGGILRIIAVYKTTASYYVRQYSVSGSSLALDSTLIDTANVSYVQTSPSAIFVPQSVNGLAKGRIWATWQGTNAVYPSGYKIFASYSDDYGVTWSAYATLPNTNTSYYSPTLTANKTNEIYAIFHSGMGDLQYSKNTTGTWGALVTIKSILNPYASALYDPTVKFTYPLFIYRDTAKVGFYGTWTVTTISVTPGSLGLITDKANLLTYTITTDGTMSTITESVNGTVISTKTATSGQSLIAGLTQAQWDLIKYGKYKDATGGLNTLTVTMGTNTWTYTFDKRPASDADIITHMQALKDGADYYVPSVKAKLIARTNGSVNDSFENIINGINLKKWKSGVISQSATDPKIVVSGLDFTPRHIMIFDTSSYMTVYNAEKSTSTSFWWSNAGTAPTGMTALDGTTYYVRSGGFALARGYNTTGAAIPTNWIAYE